MSETVEVEQLVPSVEPAAVYAALTSADALARWWWPHLLDTTYAVDARVGGSYQIRSEAAGIGVRGQYRELEAPGTIRMTWQWLDDGVPQPEEQVRITLEPSDGGTLVRVEHDCLGSGDGLRVGWRDVLGRLATTMTW